MKGKTKTVIIISFALIVFFTLIYVVHPPGKLDVHGETHESSLPETPLIISDGYLPGITWVDDIHPIFVRNKCGHCHTRGKEVIVEGFEELTLGIIDPDDESNAYYSYHELVYAEGPPQIQEGETLRDGQCCWPRNYPPEKQRRIWIGHPERSVLYRKLERDYYDWDKPPRFFDEALKLTWGVPMPIYHEEREGGEHATRYYEIQPFYKRIIFNLSLWLGGSRDELHQWPPRIPASDRLLLRYWINNAVQLMEEDTVIEVQVTGPDGKAVNDATVRLIGNYNSIKRKEVIDRLDIKTDTDNKASLSFPKYSVITSTWFIAAEKDGIKLGRNMKVHDLLTAYPFIKDYLIQLHPHFKKLNNPLMMKTVGRVATLNKAASAAGIPTDKFISGIADEIKIKTGGTIEIESDDTLTE